MADTFTFSRQVAPEVIAYFDAKTMRPAFSWLDVWGEEHAHAFTVAKATEMDVLESIRDAVREAIDEGQTFETFRDNLEPTLKKLGWWGRQTQRDPDTGEDVEVQLGSPRRLRTIYRANLRSARAAGQWERIERTKALLPFLLYQLGPSEKHRPHHVEKAGLVLPVDDPFWREWMPPNGWGCKCWVRQITAAEARKRGIGTAPPPNRKPHVNPRSGEVTDVPDGIDPGWHTNPGQARMATLMRNAADRLAQEGETNARTAIGDLWREPFARAFVNVSGRVSAPAGHSATAQASLRAASPLVEIDNETLRGLVAADDSLTPEDFANVHRAIHEGSADGEIRDGVFTFKTTIDQTDWDVDLVRDAEDRMRVERLAIGRRPG